MFGLSIWEILIVAVIGLILIAAKVAVVLFIIHLYRRGVFTQSGCACHRDHADDGHHAR